MFLIFQQYFFVVLEAAQSRQNLQSRLLQVSNELLSLGAVSYVYGGHRVGDDRQCKECQSCLGEKKPKPKQRLKVCASCLHCSLDCSHFVQLVYEKSGMPFPYLTTQVMREAPPHVLRRYKLVDLGVRLQVAQPGDLLVYLNHVVMLERVTQSERGDVIHATGGRDLKGPGHGIQRERSVPLRSFRGPLLKILRHQRLL